MAKALAIVKEEPALDVVKEEPAGLSVVKEEKADNRARENLPETLNFAGLDTGVSIPPELSAYLVQMGAGVSGSYRGAKQFLGLDKGAEAGNETALRALTEDPQVGGYATAGRFAGAGLDPVTYVLPVAKGAKTLVDMAKYGAVSGGAAGFLNPVEEGGSRAVNTAVGGAAGAVLAPVVGAIATRGKMPFRSGPEVLPPAPAPLQLTYKPQPLIVDQDGRVFSPAQEAEALRARYAPRPADVPEPQGTTYEVGSKGIGVAGQAESDATKDAARAWRQSRMQVDEEVAPIGEVIRMRRRSGELGFTDIGTVSRLAGSSVGAATGAVTADEGATPQEIAARAAIGGVLGYQAGKLLTRGASSAQVTRSLQDLGPAVRTPEGVASVVGEAGEPLFKQEVSPGTTKQIASLAKTFFEANPGLRDPSRRISDDIMRYVAGDAVPPAMLSEHGLTPETFAQAWRASISDHARSLAYLRNVMPQAMANATPEEIAAIRAAGGELEDAAIVRPFWKKLTDTWRGLLVTQPVTAVRNAITQVGRVGLDVIQAPIDSAIQKWTGRPQLTHPLDGLEELMSLFGRNKAKTDQILQAFPKEKARLFQQYMSEVDRTAADGPVWSAIQKGVDTANIINRTQEFMIRRGIFQSALDVEMRNRGRDLSEIIRTNALGAIPDDAVKAAVTQSLQKTFGETPAYGTLAKKWIDAVNATPGLNIAIPFPRFMVNAIKFQYQYSPMGILSYLSEAERKAFAAGDVSRVSKAIIGSGLFGAAMLARNDEHAGEKWYEYVKDDGTVADLRPFNPFASYLFAADVLKKWKDGTLYKLSADDVAQGLLSTNMRAGTGLYLLDNALNTLSKTADEQKLGSKAGQLTGDFLAGFLTPLAPFRDAYDQITQGQTIARDTRQEFAGPIKNQIPAVSQTLPVKESPTREGPVVTVNPALRQVSGMTVHGPKNDFEKELDRLGFSGRDVLPSSGDKEIDRKYAEGMGIVSERLLVPLVQAEKFKDLSDTKKAALIEDALHEVRSDVHEAVNEDLPLDKQIKLELKKVPPRLRILLKEYRPDLFGAKVPE